MKTDQVDIITLNNLHGLIAECEILVGNAFCSFGLAPIYFKPGTAQGRGLGLTPLSHFYSKKIISIKKIAK